MAYFVVYLYKLLVTFFFFDDKCAKSLFFMCFLTLPGCGDMLVKWSNSTQLIWICVSYWYISVFLWQGHSSLNQEKHISAHFYAYSAKMGMRQHWWWGSLWGKAWFAIFKFIAEHIMETISDANQTSLSMLSISRKQITKAQIQK